MFNIVSILQNNNLINVAKHKHIKLRWGTQQILQNSAVITVEPECTGVQTYRAINTTEDSLRKSSFMAHADSPLANSQCIYALCACVQLAAVCVQLSLTLNISLSIDSVCSDTTSFSNSMMIFYNPIRAESFLTVGL